jgi:hypothetical protein
LSTPKKPGTDLAALKARLAKKTKEGEAPAAPPPESLPPPGEVAPMPAAAPAHFAPADVPPPGQVAPPPSASPHSAAPPVSDDPFGGGQAGAPMAPTFDTSTSFDVGGEVKGRSNTGLVVFALLGGVLIGSAVGWMLHKVSSTRERIDAGKAKGAEMVKEVEQVAETRKAISLAMEDMKKAIASDPKAGAEQLAQMVQTNFEQHPKVETLFGWQLAAVNPNGVKRVFELYEAANRLRTELLYTVGFLLEHADSIAQGSAMAPVFAVLFDDKGNAKLVEAMGPMCGESLENIAALKPCEDATKALAYKVREAPAGEGKVVPKGVAPGAAMILSSEGPVYNYAIGAQPQRNAATLFGAMMQRIDERLAEMNKAEATALKALSNYADSPDVDGSNPQPDPG